MINRFVRRQLSVNRRFAIHLLALSCLVPAVQATVISASLSHSGFSITRKGQITRVELGRLPVDLAGKVTALSWQIHTVAAWPQPPLIFLCHDNDCQPLASVTGRSTRFSGKSREGRWSITIELPGRGTLQTPVVITQVTVTVNSRVGEVRAKR